MRAIHLAALILLNLAITAVTSNGQIDTEKTGGPPVHYAPMRIAPAAPNLIMQPVVPIYHAHPHANGFDPAPIYTLRGGSEKTEKNSSSSSQSSSAVGDSTRKESSAQSPSPSPSSTTSPSLQASPSPSVSEKSQDLKKKPKPKSTSVPVDPDKTGGTRF